MTQPKMSATANQAGVAQGTGSKKASTRKPSAQRAATKSTKTTATTKPAAKNTATSAATPKAPSKQTSSRTATTAQKRPAAKKPVAKVNTAPPNTKPVDPEDRSRMIAAAAYFRAQERGFTGGDSIQDWLAAEAEVDARLAGS